MSTGLLALVFAAASGGASPDGGAPPPRAAAPATAAAAQKPAPLTSPAPAPSSKEGRPPQVERPRNRHVPPPYTDRTTSPMLDSSRSTIEPDREALPHDLQDMRLAPYGPAPPDVTPTHEANGRNGGGAKRVQEIHAPPDGGRGPASPPPAATPPAASSPDPRRTP